MRFENDGYGKTNEDNVSDYIAGAHRDELSDALSAHRARIWNDLPVMIEWLALGQSCDDYGEESDDKEPADTL